MEQQLINQTIGEIVAENFRTAAVFYKHGIDFCCRGNRLIADVCQKKQLDQQQIESELLAVLNTQEAQADDPKTWTLAQLIDHIVPTHHRYIEEKSPIILQFLENYARYMGTDIQNSLKYTNILVIPPRTLRHT